MEFRTVEVRWFSAGRCPEAVTNWFLAGPLVSEPERRTDDYLLLPESDELGVKLRGSSLLELKLRTGSVNEVSLPGLDGRVEAWTKWSFLLDSAGARPAEESWIPVEKTRWSRIYEVHENGECTAVSTGRTLSNACAAELVEVRIGSRLSWGFGFEAFSQTLEAAVVLEEAASRFVQDTPLDDLTFGEANSHSYPSWLQVWPEAE